MIAFTVVGKPEPQGSKTAGLTKSGRAFVRDKAPAALKKWRDAVSATAASVSDGLLDGPVRVRLVFVFERGKTVRRDMPSVRPDIDKLARAVLDALTGHAFADDSQVCDLSAVKEYGATAGVRVEVSEIKRGTD